MPVTKFLLVIEPESRQPWTQVTVWQGSIYSRPPFRTSGDFRVGQVQHGHGFLIFALR